MPLRPFQRPRFDDLPQEPRLPHVFHRAEVLDIALPSKHFGEIRTSIRAMGSGPPLLLLHGLMTTSYTFRYVLEPLSEHFRVYAPDLPGSGRSGKPTSADFSPSNMASFVGELQRALDIRGCAMLGNSLGGYIAMHLALQDPGAISRLVVNHSPGTPHPRYHLLHALLGNSLGRGILRKLVQRDPRRWVFRNVHYYDESLKSIEELDEYGAPLATEDGFACFVKSLHETLAPAGFASFMQKLEAAPFPVPLLFVYAKKDPMVPPSVGEALHKACRGSTLRWLDGSSHFSHVDSPERMLELVIPFLRQNQ